MKAECVGRLGRMPTTNTQTFMRRIAEPSAGPEMKTRGSTPPQFVL